MQSKGFTLIELLISAVILAVAICGLILQINNGILLNKINRDFTVALSHAQYVLEEIKNTPLDQVRTRIPDVGGISPGPTGWDYSTDAEITAAGLNPLSFEEINTSCNVAGCLGNPVDVSVTVTWSRFDPDDVPDPRQRQIELRTLFN